SPWWRCLRLQTLSLTAVDWGTATMLVVEAMLTAADFAPTAGLEPAGGVWAGWRTGWRAAR
ncbi:MAG: hypothetical protein EBZ04_08260, partial [Betaproteobacteria bacterium]|nr:hypothetical protein [Betaproteobacteria bacterium]